MGTTRRDFLKISAAGGAALVVGVSWAAEGAAAGPLAPTVWVRVEPTGKVIVTLGKSEMGQGVRTSLAMIAADELDADWKDVDVEQAMPGPAYGRLGTGGSWSVAGNWEPLRKAAAAAREMLVAAAAARWKVDCSAVRTERGVARHEPSGKKARYGELVAAAARLPIPEAPRLKSLDELRLVGKPTKRIDGPRIVAGAAQYGIDVRVPGMKFVSIERGKPARVDDAAARAVAGVRDVVTVPSGVAVIADSTWAAMKGRRALKIDWQSAGDFDSKSHWRKLEEAAKEAGVVTRGEGGAWPAVHGRFREARYHYGFAVHAPVEPMNCIAHVKDGRCEVWAPTQAPSRVKRMVSEALGVPLDAVAVHVTLLGGGFGRRLGADYAVEAAEVARKVKVPVQVVWSRSDDMRDGYFQAASIHDMWGALDSGRVIAWKHKKISTPHNLDGPPSAEDLQDAPAFFRGSSWGAYDVPYAFPSLETSYVRVDAPVLIGPWRAVFAPSSVFARECFVDELAEAAELDPLAFRLIHLPETKTTIDDEQIDRRRLRGVLQLVAEKSGWGKPLPPGRFRGLACNQFNGGTHVAYVAEVSADGKVHRVFAAVDCGIVVNPLGVEQQVDSGIAWALSNMKAEITFKDGRAEQVSYVDYPVLRMSEMPVVETYIVPSRESPTGMGEPVVPPLAPAVANALHAATGKRIRRLPVLV